MSNYRLVLLHLSCILGVLRMVTPCAAETNALERAVIDFPDGMVAGYRPDSAALCANVLIAMGRQKACSVLSTMSSDDRNSGNVNEKVCHLCRLLFQSPDRTKPLRRAALGNLPKLPVSSMQPEDWPDVPFVVVSNVPLSLNLGYGLAGRAEQAPDYLRYCMSNGVFRAEAFLVPSSATASNALSALFASPRWKSLRWKSQGVEWSYDFSEPEVRERLWQQAENMKPPSK